MKIVYRILVCCVVVCITAACSSSAHIVIRDNTNYDLIAEFIPSSLLEKNITHLLKQKSEHADGQSVFNVQELKEAFTKEGISVQDITLKGVLGLRLACAVPYNHGLLKDIIGYDKKGRKTVLRISPENIASFLKILPQESRDFIDMLMAPLFTGDAIPPAEYEELIGAAYGKKIATERISPVGTVPVQTKTEKTSRASIRIPLIELLCTVGTIETQLQ